jgi:phenylacetate-coenzyme A ligase PaaK-like adenylate-forming protein
VLLSGIRHARLASAQLGGRRIRISDLTGLAAELRATRDEFGGLTDVRVGAEVDDEVRTQILTRRLRRTLRLAREQVPYYRERLAGADIDLRRLTADDFVAAVTITPKRHLKALPEAFVADNATPVLRAETTGTTGEPTAVWFSDYELSLTSSLGTVLFFGLDGVDESDIMVVATSSRAPLSMAMLIERCRRLGAGVLPVGLVHPEIALDALLRVHRLPGKRAQATSLTTYPSHLASIVALAEERGLGPTDFGLRTITSAGEVLTDALRVRAAAVLGAEIIDNYAMTEIYPLAGRSCRAGHLHFANDFAVIEVVDPGTGREAADGTVGSLVVTPLFPFRDTTIVLRLDTGDLTRRVTGATCELAATPAVEPLLGKAALTTAAGTTAIHQRDVLEALQAEPALPLPTRYSVRAGGGTVELHVFAGPVADGAAGAALHRRIAERLPGLDRITLHADRHDVPDPVPLRTDLRETHFGNRSREPVPG